VYGNEYLEANVPKATTLLTKLLEKQPNANPKNTVGGICKGDSSDLSFVPANSFDLVFTGYASPLWDPLKLQATNAEEFDSTVKTMCNAANFGDRTAQEFSTGGAKSSGRLVFELV